MANNRFANACSTVLFSLWVLSIPALPIVAIWKYIVGYRQFSMIALAVWIISFVAFCFYNKALNKADKAKKLQEEIERQKWKKKHLEQRKLEGIMKLDDGYKLVDSSNWDSKWNNRKDGFVDWLEDEIQELQSEDKVYHYKFGHGMGLRIGYVIVRKGKVVANALEIIS